MSTQLTRQTLFGVPEQTVRVIKTFNIDADEQFCTYIRNGAVQGDVFSVPDPDDVTTLETIDALAEGDYIDIVFAPAATISGQPVISAATVVAN